MFTLHTVFFSKRGDKNVKNICHKNFLYFTIPLSLNALINIYDKISIFLVEIYIYICILPLGD